MLIVSSFHTLFSRLSDRWERVGNKDSITRIANSIRNSVPSFDLAYPGFITSGGWNGCKKPASGNFFGIHDFINLLYTSLLDKIWPYQWVPLNVLTAVKSPDVDILLFSSYRMFWLKSISQADFNRSGRSSSTPTLFTCSLLKLSKYFFCPSIHIYY